VTRERLIDLDDPGHVELLWQELERRRFLRRIDPELRHAIEVRCKRFAPEVAAPILAALDEMHPEAVVDAYLDVFLTERPTIGAVIRHRYRPPGP
jgi:hypothetical protein